MADGIIVTHLKSYPLSQPQDIVKLLFQRCLGPGHMVTDEQKVREYIEAESEHAPLDIAEDPAEPIGNGFSRFHLKALNESYGAAELTADFIRSAKYSGDREDLVNELKILTESDWLYESASFTKEEFTEFAEWYIQAGCPMISHSEKYRNAYRPAYRVIRKD